jgi:hypothetical protein
VDGKLTLATRRGAETYALMKDGALGLSIGFRVNPGGAVYEGSVRILKSLQLFEVSAVALPANPAARVTGVKSSASIMRPGNIREFEAALHDACGFSVREAKRMASAGWAALQRKDDSEEVQEIAALFLKAATEFNSQQR